MIYPGDRLFPENSMDKIKKWFPEAENHFFCNLTATK